MATAGKEVFRLRDACTHGVITNIGPYGSGPGFIGASRALITKAEEVTPGTWEFEAEPVEDEDSAQP